MDQPAQELHLGGFGGKPLVDGVRCSFADKDAGSVNSRSYWRDRGRRSAGEKRAPAAQTVLRQPLLDAARLAQLPALRSRHRDR